MINKDTSHFTLDWTINIGHLITLGGVIVALIAGFINASSRIDRTEKDLYGVQAVLAKQQVTIDVLTISNARLTAILERMDQEKSRK